jgi:hypothetical protein
VLSDGQGRSSDRVEIRRIRPRFGTDHDPRDMPSSNRPELLPLRSELPIDLTVTGFSLVSSPVKDQQTSIVRTSAGDVR